MYTDNIRIARLANALRLAEGAHTSWTAALLAEVASACGVAGGNWKAVEREQITQAVLDEIASNLALAYAELGESQALQDLARRATAGRVKAALGRWGLKAVKVSVIYRTSDSKSSQKLKFTPQWVYGDEDNGQWIIGIAITLPEQKKENPLPDPRNEPDERAEQADADHEERQRLQLAETQAKEADAKNFAVAVEAAASLMLAEHGLRQFDDDDLIAELKRRGFRVSRIRTKKSAPA